MSYIPYATSSKDQTGDIFTFTRFEEVNLLLETLNNTESGKKSNDDSNLAPIISDDDINVMPSYDDSDAEHMSIYMLEDICDRSKSHPIINMREARYKICSNFKHSQEEWKGALFSTQSMDKYLNKIFQAVLMIFHKHCKFFVNEDQKLLTSFHNLETL